MAQSRSTPDQKNLDLNTLAECLGHIQNYEKKEKESSSKNLREVLTFLKNVIFVQYFSVIKGTALNTESIPENDDEESDALDKTKFNAGNYLCRATQVLNSEEEGTPSTRGRVLATDIQDSLLHASVKPVVDVDDKKEKGITIIEGEIKDSESDEIIATVDPSDDGTGVGVVKKTGEESSDSKLKGPKKSHSREKTAIGHSAAPGQTNDSSEEEVSENNIPLKSDQEIQQLFSNVFMLQIRACFDSLNKKHDFSFMENKLHAAVHAELEKRFNKISKAFNQQSNNTFNFQNLREKAYQAVIDSFDLFGLLPYSRSDSTVQACLKQFLNLMSSTLDQGTFNTPRDHLNYLVHRIKRPIAKSSDIKKANAAHQLSDEEKDVIVDQSASSETEQPKDTKQKSKKSNAPSSEKDNEDQDPMIEAGSDDEKNVSAEDPGKKGKKSAPETLTQKKQTTKEFKTKFYGVVANIFRLYDWYADNDMGWELASELGIERNGKQGRLEALQHLRDQVTLMLNEPNLKLQWGTNANLDALKTKILKTCTAIQKTFGGKNSRLAKGLADLIAILDNQTSEVIPPKYNIPKGIFMITKGEKTATTSSVQQQKILLNYSLEDSQQYIQRHFLVQSRRAVTNYIQEGYHRNMTTWDDEKKQAALEQNRALFKAQRKVEHPVTPASKQKEDFKKQIGNVATIASATSPKVALGFLNNIIDFIRNIMAPKADPNGAVTKAEDSIFSKHSFFKMTQTVERIVNPKIPKPGNPAGQRTTGTPQSVKKPYPHTFRR